MTPIDPGFSDFFGFIGLTIVASLIVPLLITVLVIVLIVWAIRRNAPRGDPAIAELKARYARGEIDTAEFQVRMRELTGG